MNRSRPRSILGGIGLLSLATTIGVALALPTLASASTHKKKGLTMSTVTMTGGMVPLDAPVWVAMDQGFFKKQGLSVNYTAAASSSVQTTILVSGAAQFAVDSLASDVAADQQGAGIRAVDQDALNTEQELVITQAAATQFNVPAAGNTLGSTEAQLRALKGSHIVVAISTVTSNAFTALAAVAKTLGLTYGIACGTCDINVTATGSPATEVTALQSGKVAGLVNGPPTTVVSAPPTTVTIEIWRVPPLPRVIGNYFSTTTQMISQHADSVQAAVTGMVQASGWLKVHSGQAEKDTARHLAIYGITSPEEQEYLYSGIASRLTSPFPSRSIYDQSVAATNLTTSTPITIPYSQYVVPRFATKAGKVLGVKF